MSHKPYFRRPDIKQPHSLAPQSWTPNQIFAAYGLPKLMGPISPQTIGILELGGGWNSRDLANAFSDWGLPVPTVKDVSVQGGSNSPGNDADGEVALDIQWAAAAYSYMTGLPAPIRCYFSPNSDQGYLGCYQQMRADRVSVGSSSWGSTEDQWVRTAIDSFTSELLLHQSLGIYQFAASGDNDSGDGESGVHTDYPASDPGMIGCGGTSKTRTAETVWNNGNGSGTGGGYSSVFPVQSWQIGAPAGPGRMVPDIATNADPETGYPVYLNGQVQIIGGTSAVAPIYAGIFAALKGWSIANGKTPPANLLQWLWSHQAAFADITQGNNGQWRAGVGPDPCTGLGVPSAGLFAAWSGGTVAPPPVVDPPIPACPVPIMSFTSFRDYPVNATINLHLGKPLPHGRYGIIAEPTPNELELEIFAN